MQVCFIIRICVCVCQKGKISCTFPKSHQTVQPPFLSLNPVSPLPRLCRHYVVSHILDAVGAKRNLTLWTPVNFVE
jgi:hypothetical protein